MIAWLRAKLGCSQASAAQEPPAGEWRIECQLLAPLKLSRWRTARRGEVVSLPAWQAIGLHRGGKARVHLGVTSVPDDFQAPAAPASSQQGPHRGLTW